MIDTAAPPPKTPTALETIEKSLQASTVTYEISPSSATNKEKLAAMPVEILFDFYKACKDAREARIIIFYELVRRGKVGGKTVNGVTALEAFCDKYGLNYETESKFVYRDKQARLEELNPPKPTEETEELEPLTVGGVVFETTNLEKPLVVKQDNITTGEVEVEDQSGDEAVKLTRPRETLITDNEKLEAETKAAEAAKRVCKKCATKDRTIATRDTQIETLKADIVKLKADKKALKEEVSKLKNDQRQRIVANNMQADQLRKLTKPAVYNPSSKLTKIGDRSAINGGLYIEMIKDGKTPFAIYDEANMNPGALTTSKSQADAELWISNLVRERNDAKAKSAAV